MSYVMSVSSLALHVGLQANLGDTLCLVPDAGIKGDGQQRESWEPLGFPVCVEVRFTPY